MTTKPPVDLDIVARLSLLPEELIIEYFWLMVSHNADRLELLSQLGAVTVERPPEWDYRAVRREHETTRGGTMFPSSDFCFACKTSVTQLYRHHVVEVHRGGSNAPRNQVPLCFKCHQYLHPWLKEEPAPVSRKAESAREVIPRLLDAIEKQTRRWG